jgi:hypothetical protein
VKPLYLVAVIAAAVVVAGCGGPGTFTAHGTDLVCADITSGTSAADAYPDISDGGQVTVTDSTGKVIGTGTLVSTPVPTKVASLGGASVAEFFGSYKFSVTVPGGLQRYGIQIGQNRGTVWFSPSKMQSGPSVSLGC